MSQRPQPWMANADATGEQEGRFVLAGAVGLAWLAPVSVAVSDIGNCTVRVGETRLKPARRASPVLRQMSSGGNRPDSGTRD